MSDPVGLPEHQLHRTIRDLQTRVSKLERTPKYALGGIRHDLLLTIEGLTTLGFTALPGGASPSVQVEIGPALKAVVMLTAQVQITDSAGGSTPTAYASFQIVDPSSNVTFEPSFSTTVRMMGVSGDTVGTHPQGTRIVEITNNAPGLFLGLETEYLAPFPEPGEYTVRTRFAVSRTDATYFLFSCNLLVLPL